MLYRDVQYVIPFLVQLWMFVSPVIYPIEQHPGRSAARRLRAEPDDRRDRRLSLGAARPAVPAGGYLWISLAVVAVLLVGGLVLLQAHGARVRRCGVDHERRRPAHRRPRQDVPHRRRARGVPHAARHARAGSQAADRAHPPPGRGDARLGGPLGAEGRRPRGQARRGARHHRPQRRRQEHAAQGALAHHRADRGQGRDQGPGGEPARGGHRLPPRAHRPREHPAERRHPRA